MSVLDCGRSKFLGLGCLKRNISSDLSIHSPAYVPKAKFGREGGGRGEGARTHRLGHGL